MNERIRQLERQAMISVLNGNDPDGDVDRMYISAEFTKKFAELIVAECALTAGLMEHEGRKGIGAQILDNFGVEE